jgi:RNase P protein component
MDTTIPGNRIPGKDFSVKILSNVAARGDTQLFDHLVSRGADPHRTETRYVSRVGISDSRVVVRRSHLRARISRVAIW